MFCRVPAPEPPPPPVNVAGSRGVADGAAVTSAAALFGLLFDAWMTTRSALPAAVEAMPSSSTVTETV